MATKKSRFWRRFALAKKELVIAGVDPKVIEEAFRKAQDTNSKVLRGCPTNVSKKIGLLLEDVGDREIAVRRPESDVVEVLLKDRHGKVLEKNVFTPTNWSAPKTRTR